jgi:Ca2+-binding EF-hand superfamily protein
MSDDPQPAVDAGAEPDDVAGEGEREFATGMRQAEIDRQLADADEDGMLTLDEFCSLVKEREEGEHTDEELRERFNRLDTDGSGRIELNEYLRWALRDALARGGTRVIDLFRKWDDDQSGEISRDEFIRAIRAFGCAADAVPPARASPDHAATPERRAPTVCTMYSSRYHYPDAEIGAVFDELDVDGSGSIDYRELNKVLRRGEGSLAAELQPGVAPTPSPPPPPPAPALRSRLPGSTRLSRARFCGRSNGRDPDQGEIPAQAAQGRRPRHARLRPQLRRHPRARRGGGRAGAAERRTPASPAPVKRQPQAHQLHTR